MSHQMMSTAMTSAKQRLQRLPLLNDINEGLASPVAGVFGFGWWYYPQSEGATALA